jgi:hypothetical protein
MHGPNGWGSWAKGMVGMTKDVVVTILELDKRGKADRPVGQMEQGMKVQGHSILYWYHHFWDHLYWGDHYLAWDLGPVP